MINLDAIAKAFQEGGEFMYFITLTSAFAWAIILDRIFFLFWRYRVDAARVLEVLEQALARGRKPAEADELEQWGGSPVVQVAMAAIRRTDAPPRFVWDRVFEAYLRVVPQIQQRISYLSMLANVATLLGLLGTILGLIQAFAGVAAADPAHKQAMLASGIAVAMNTTAYGLMVAIPCLVAHAILSARANRLLAWVEAIRTRVRGWVDARGMAEAA